MTIEELKQTGALYIENIVQGLKQHSHKTVVMTQKEAQAKFHVLWKSAGEGNAFVDFYYFILTEPEKQAVETYLSEEEIQYLRKRAGELKPEADRHVVFVLDEMLLQIAAVLNEKAALFSTFYFTGEEKSTWWGNYNGEYICFAEA